MVDQETLRKAQLKMVEILEAIDNVCKKNDIEYFLCYGTLLGAVRHNGFIPWDDDCDIVMMKEHYERFIQCAERDLPSTFFLQHNGTDKAYTKKVTKVRMKDTKFIEHDESDNEKYCQGLFVDIFVWDYHYGFEKSLTKCLRSIAALRYKRKKYKKGSLKRVLVHLLTAIPYLVGYSTVQKVYCALSKIWCNNKDLQWLGREAKLQDCVFVKKSVIYPIRYDVGFEGRFFPVPNDYEKFLKDRYGDYMTPPPECERELRHAKYIEC
ncbi:MAG: LicD family protein [Lachnospiraceae bacterium]|nr:LicD family protein [Lachnospiraceae bacterium]